MSDDERVTLTKSEALKRMDWRRGRVHVMSNGNGILIGCDWRRKAVADHLMHHTAELAGPVATHMGHGIYAGGYYFATKDET